MNRPEGTVWITEQDLDDESPARGTVWTGRFGAWHDLGDGAAAARLDDATAAEAVSWGRERAPHVWIRLGDSDYFAAGDGHAPDDDAPRWDPALAPARRRPPGEQWRDRAEDAEPIDWLVEVDLSPPHIRPRPDWEAKVARIAARGGASGWRARGDADDGRVGGWVEIPERFEDRAWLILDRGGVSGWGRFEATSYRLAFTLPAATVVHAMEYALDRCLVEPSWAATAYGRPAPRTPETPSAPQSRGARFNMGGAGFEPA
jgi:hypothetical protein